jgi:hypothetical protein
VARTVALDQVAIAHSGDKGNRCNVGVIPLRYSDYDLVVEQVTAARVRALYGELVKGEVRRFELPGSRCLNFVLEDGMDGGSPVSIHVDRHGMARAALILTLGVDVPDDWEPAVVDEHGHVH